MKRRRWFRLPVREQSLSERDVDAELAAHVEARVERYMAEGMSEADARAAAEQRLGGPPARYALKRAAWERDARLSARERLRSWADDIRYALRAVFRERGYALVVIITLALGIGANATMFGLLDRLLLSGPAHVVEPDELFRFYATTQPTDGVGEPSTFSALNGPLLTAFREHVTALEGISGYFWASLTLGEGETARRLELTGVSASFFGMVGVQPALGRFFTEAEDTPPEGERVIVVSHALWQSEFGGRSDAIGSTLLLSGTPYTVIGVAPPGFTGVELAPQDGWVPLATAASSSMGPQWHTRWSGYYMPIVGRLREGASLEQATAQANGGAWRAAATGTWAEQTETSVSLKGIRTNRDGVEPMEARVARWLMAVAAIVLLVAAANVANLYFARGLARRREIAVRLALGVSRGRLIRMLLVESMLLAVLGGVAALAVAYWGAEIVRNVLVPDVDWTTSPLNGRVLAVSAAVTLLVGLVTGLAPALMSANPRLAPALVGSLHASPASSRTRNVLAIAQAAFCVLLLVGAGLFVRSLWGVLRLDLGFDSDRVVSMRFEWQTPAGLSAEERTQLSARRSVFMLDAAERVAAQPGVEFASVAIGSAFGGGYGATLRAEGVDSIPSMPGGGPYLSAVSADYFHTLGTPVLRGRVFTAGEGAGTDPVVIVSRTTADKLWPGADPLDRCVYMGGAADAPCSRVVGVVADARRWRITEEAAMQFYVPLGQQPGWMAGIGLLARTSGRPSTMVEPLRRVLHGMEPSLRYISIQPFAEYLEPQRRPWRMGAVVFALFGGLALCIAAVGLYSVIAYLVQQRRREIGVRMALGAERGSVVMMVLRQALVLAGSGVLLGAVVALIAAPYLEPLLFNTPARDVAVLAGAAAALLATAMAAGALPAWRASRVAPTEALRET
jgi:predicted permease